MNNGWEKYFKPCYTEITEVAQPKKEKIFFASMSFLIACGLLINYRITENKTDRLNFSLSTRPALYTKLELLEAQNSVLESDIINLEHEFSNLVESKANQFLENYNTLLALDNYSGEGVILKLEDSNKPLTFGENPNLMIVHNQDLLMIVNELWGGGAKAISVNDQRITATSEFNCIGPIILVNNTRILPPFTIKAVGNADKLYETVKEGYVKKDNLEKYGITFSVKKSEKIRIPATSQSSLVSVKGKYQ